MVLIQFVQINLDNFSVFFSLDNALCKGTWIKNVDNQINTTIIKFIRNTFWIALLKFWYQSIIEVTSSQNINGIAKIEILIEWKLWYAENLSLEMYLIDG